MLNNDSEVSVKTDIYHKTKNGFTINFLQNVLSIEIRKVVEMQSSFITLLDSMINNLKERSLKMEDNNG